MSNSKPRIVALLPMKANSERVKGKNFRLFNGKPLFQWVLDTLLSVDSFTTCSSLYLITNWRRSPRRTLSCVACFAGLKLI